MPLIPIILFLIIFSTSLKKAKKNQQNTERMAQSSNPVFSSTPSQRYRAQKTAQRAVKTTDPTQNDPSPAVTPSKSSRRRVDDHLCDPDQHLEETRSALETLQMLEEDYQPYDGSVERYGSMTASQYRRKLAELDDLRDAGIISPEEHREKVREYRTILR